MEREPIEPRPIGLGLCIAYLKVRYQRPGMSGCHAGAQAKVKRYRTGGGHHIALSGPGNQDRGPSP